MIRQHGSSYSFREDDNSGKCDPGMVDDFMKLRAGQPPMGSGEEKINRWTVVRLQLGRWEAKTIVGLISGHTEENNDIITTGSAVNPDCRSCGVEE